MLDASIALGWLAITTWIFFDASKRDWSDSKLARSAWWWVGGMVAMAILVLPIYLVAREKRPVKRDSTGPGAPAGWLPPSAAASVVATVAPVWTPPTVAVAAAGAAASASADRSCPRCRSSARQDATACGFCGHDLD